MKKKIPKSKYDVKAETRVWVLGAPRNEIADEVWEMILYREMLQARYDQLREELIRVRSVIQQDDVDRVKDVELINIALHEEGWPDVLKRKKKNEQSSI